MKKYWKIYLLMILVVSLAGMSWFGKAFWIKYYGIRLKPAEVIAPPKNLDYFLQNDPGWKDEKVGSTNNTLGAYGCLIACLATSINWLNKEKHTPLTLNQLFTQKKTYNENGMILWLKIKEAVKGVDYSYEKRFDAKTIEQDLKKGLLPIVKVKYKKTGIFHWVLIVGSTQDDFLIIDPLREDKTLIALDATHGNVFAYRVLKRV